MFPLPETSKWKSDLRFVGKYFSEFLYVARGAFRKAFWTVSADGNTNFTSVSPSLNPFIFRAKSVISKDHSILQFLSRADVLTTNNKADAKSLAS